MASHQKPKAALYKRYPVSRVVIYNASAILHYLTGTTGTASAVAYREEKREMDSHPPFRFVTASLKVNFLKPTPMGERLELRGRVTEIKERKIIIKITVTARNGGCAEGEVVAVKMPEDMMPNPPR